MRIHGYEVTGQVTSDDMYAGAVVHLRCRPLGIGSQCWFASSGWYPFAHEESERELYDVYVDLLVMPGAACS